MNDPFFKASGNKKAAGSTSVIAGKNGNVEKRIPRPQYTKKLQPGKQSKFAVPKTNSNHSGSGATKRAIMERLKTTRNNELEDEEDSEEEEATARQLLNSLDAPTVKTKNTPLDENEIDAEVIDKSILDSRWQSEKQTLYRNTPVTFRETLSELVSSSDSIAGAPYQWSLKNILQKSSNTWQKHIWTQVSILENSSDSASFVVWAGAKDGFLAKIILDKDGEIIEAKSIKSPMRQNKNKKNGPFGITSMAAWAGFVAVGRQNGTLELLEDNLNTTKITTITKGHINASVTAVSFLKAYPPTSFYSCGSDRKLILWDVNHTMSLDTLFGPTSIPSAIDVLFKETPLVGCGLDRTTKLFKIQQGTQLLFPGSEDSAPLDCVNYMSGDRFITISNAAQLIYWQTSRKSPLAKWILSEFSSVHSVAAMPFTDLIAVSGICPLGNTILCMYVIPATTSNTLVPIESKILPSGFVNSLQFLPLTLTDTSIDTISWKQVILVMAVGTEQRLGRWETFPSGHNGLYVMRLENSPCTTEQDENLSLFYEASNDSEIELQQVFQDSEIEFQENSD